MPVRSYNVGTMVALFNSRYTLVAIFGSIKEASRVTGVVRQSIIKAVYGEIISVRDCYWRPIPDDIVIDQDDIGTLDMFTFDREIGAPDRKIYKSRKMGRRLDIIMESEHPKNKI